MTELTDREMLLGEALQVAAGEGYTDLVPLLLGAGADANYCSPSDEFRMTPIVGMIFENSFLPAHAGIARLLLEAGLDLRHVSNEWTAYEYARHYERHDLMPLLMPA